MTKLFFVVASTGCTCCRNENSIHGPYSSQGKAKCVAKAMHETQYVRSQYSTNGEYDLYSADYEELQDGRKVVGRLVFGKDEGDSEYCCELGHPDQFLTHMNAGRESASSSKWFLQ